MKIKEILIPLSIITVLVAFIIIASTEGLEKQLKVDCYTWQRYERDFPLFELQEREVKMCKELGVDIK